MKKTMIWCSLLSLVLLKIFAIYKGVKFGIIPKSYDVVTFLMVGLGTFIVYLLYKIGEKKKTLYNIFLIGCIIGTDGFSEGSLEKTLHTLGMISLLIFIVSFISLEKKYYK
ncbi:MULTISPECIES: hypothetical protein [Psychrilyobacter]|uniref:Uncharacterized protein n=1 Tax=Psychrilyobacter piezotolerans TaxID=2293438 RepID=A0ABX9KDM9_9FUSO|nr:MULTISPECIES: hypothetical protein [Psychrilyobacter]MCS5422477.1 hypothetical protein [Psychrilyobacter sp. S5]NDI79019.1 hypothetical protein [Psychrilyobacter piezotolerans]RDE59102.1 hypothetical protein DV867_13825 [Psychrilyobacter sp. S5]REI39673.1 hypothetical protein DYH56_13825 [Psychrilyobacter piezotolerans]